MKHTEPRAAQHKAVEYEAFYLFENNRAKFNQLVREGFFSEANTTPFIEQLKDKAYDDSYELQMKAERQAQLSQKPFFEITQQNQLDSEKDKTKESHIAKAIWKSLIPTPFQAMFRF